MWESQKKPEEEITMGVTGTDSGASGPLAMSFLDLKVGVYVSTLAHKCMLLTM